MDKKPLIEKCLAVGIILLFVATGIIPSKSATISSNAASSTSIQLVINNDGGGDPTDKNVDVPAYVPNSGITPVLTINFTITGTNITETTAFYGDDPWENWKNITVTGDILYPVNEATIYHVGTKGDWNCYVTPTKPSGVISLRIDWPDNGSANNSIQIVNGTFVTPLVDSFQLGQDFNLTVIVRDIDGEAVKIGNVYIMWEEDDYEFNHTTGDNTQGNGANGDYTFWVTKEDQGGFTLKNITITAQWYPGSGYFGYAKVAMKQPSSAPTINGPHYGKVNTVYTFSVGPITDPDGDLFYGLWDFGDGSQGNWQGPYEPGQTFKFSHAWSEPGNYTIKVKIKDIYGAESDWSAPFYIEIVELKVGVFLGMYKDFSGTDDLWIIQAGFCIVFPSNQIFNNGKTIVTSKDCLFYRGLKFTVGVGGVAVINSVNSYAQQPVYPAISFVDAIGFLRGRMSNLTYENGAYGEHIVFHAECVRFIALAPFGCSVIRLFVDEDVHIRYDSPPYGYIGARSFHIMFKTKVSGPI